MRGFVISNGSDEDLYADQIPNPEARRQVIITAMPQRNRNGSTERHDVQRTKKGLEIPVPKRGDFMRNLKKVAKPSSPRSPKK